MSIGIKKERITLKHAFAFPLPISMHGNQTSGAISCLKFDFYFFFKAF